MLRFSDGAISIPQRLLPFPNERALYPADHLPIMRYFVVVGHRATTNPNFSLEDIPGTSGRLDILCRSVTAAFVLSHGIRKDVCVYLVLLGGEIPKTILLKGETLRHLNPDERTTAALLKKALAVPATGVWTPSTYGIFVRQGGLAEVLADIMDKEMRLIYLREDGSDIKALDLNQQQVAGAGRDSLFIIGDHMGMTEEEETLILGAGAGVVSLGGVSLHADHCITILNWLLDREFASSNKPEAIID